MSGAILSRASLIPLDDFLGTWLIGLIVSSVLFGVTCLQVYLYFTKHSAQDPVFLKAFVTVLLALDTLHLAIISHSFYFLTVTNFGDYAELQTAPWGLLVQIAVGVFLSTLVQLFYACRIYVLSNKSLVFPVIIAVLACVDLGLAIATVHKTISFQVKYFSLAREDIPFFASTLSTEVASAVLITGAMIYHLLRNKTGFHKTNKAINILVAYSLNSGAMAMMFAIGDLVAVNLNSRDHVREQLFSTNHAMITIPSSYTGGSSTLPADTENGLTSADKGTGKVSGSVFSSTAKECPGPHPNMF
ncbi:hypothetical protein GGX14DRAFT_644684 [Mycena pura]|uniref:Uncharacterized protein n=1 Tax=Mycena pura TaxID=153505 RepID=A0AAD6V8W4_9AGAR|nr:hypothetical protein GGX14DRAFT_644684 [Mycena pura]